MEMKFEVKVEKVNNVLVTTSNRVAEELGVNHKDLLEKIDGYAEKFTKAESSALVEEFYIPSTYKVEGNFKTYRNYLITEKGVAQLIGGYSSAVPRAFDLNVAYINKFEEMKNKLNSITTKEQYLLNILRAEGDLEKTLAIKDFDDKYIKPLENNLKQTTQKLEHKQEVINVMTDEIKMKTQRQFLNEIIKMKGGNLVKDRWKLLYNNYSSMKHINLKARFEGYNRVNTPKCKSYLEYIDNIMNDISTLYGIAVKLFESDFKDKLEKYIEVL